MAKKVLIFQMGKVGSTSFLQLLRNNGYDERKINTAQLASVVESRNDEVFHTHNYPLALRLSRAIQHSPVHHELIVITGVRDILKRNISALFQNIDNPAHPFWYLANRERFASLPISTIIEHFNTVHPVILNTLVLPWPKFLLSAVDAEGYRFRPEVYQERGWDVFESLRTKTVCYRFEDLHRCSVDVLKAAGLPCSELPRVNVSADKWYVEVYAEFLRTYRPEQYTLDTVYDSDCAHCFYTLDELNVQRQNWIV